MESRLQQTGTLLGRAYQDWRHDGAPQIAAAMSYYVLLAIAPLLVVLVTVLGRIVGRTTIYEQIIAQAEMLAGSFGVDLAEELLASVSLPATGTWLSAIAIVFAALGAARVFGQLRIAFDRIWHIPPDPVPEGLSIWQSLRRGIINIGTHNLKSFLIVLVIGGLMLASLVLSAAATVATNQLSAYFTLSPTALRLIDYSGSTALLTVLFAAVYRVLPRTTIAWRDVWVGALMTSGLFTVGRALLGLYLVKASPGSVFGAAGTVVVFLIWVNYSSQLMLYGAELTQAWAYLHGSRKGLDPGV